MKVIVDIPEDIYKIIMDGGVLLNNSQLALLQTRIMRGTPVVKGKWIDGYVHHLVTGEERAARECSVCGNRYFRYDETPDTTGEVPHYCPMCGAEMERG